MITMRPRGDKDPHPFTAHGQECIALPFSALRRTSGASSLKTPLFLQGIGTPIISVLGLQRLSSAEVDGGRLQLYVGGIEEEGGEEDWDKMDMQCNSALPQQQ